MKVIRTNKRLIGRLSNGSGGPPEEIPVPAGVIVSPIEDGTGDYFVESLGWLKGDWRLHDATYRGIRVKCGPSDLAR